MGWAGVNVGNPGTRRLRISGRPKTKPQSHPLRTRKRSLARRPQTDQKRTKNDVAWRLKTAWLGWLGWAGLTWVGLGWAWLGWAWLGCAALGWAGLGWAGLGQPFQTGKHSGTAAPNKPKTYQKRCRCGAENGPSESSKRKAFGRALARPTPMGCLGAGLGWAGWAALGWAELGWGSALATGLGLG